MKKLLSLTVALCALILQAANVEISQLTQVFYADNASAPAAKELALYLGKIFGKRFKVKLAKDSSKKGFYIGKAFAPEDVKVEHREQIFRKVDEDGRIFLWGAENSRKIPGDSRAVTTFLEDVCGVRWLCSGAANSSSKSW